MRQIQIVSTIGSEIISVDDCKNFIRIDTTEDDTLLGYMITSARLQAESYLSRDILSKQRKYYLDNALDGLVDVPYGPIDSIDEVKVDNIVITDYTERGLGDITIKMDPTDKEVLITFTTTGMSDGLLKQALLQIVSTLYDNRTDYVNGTISTELDSSSKVILNGYKSVFI